MIVEAITLISTANAAIGAVKEMIGNGRDLMDCGKELGDYFSAKSEIQKQANPSGKGSDLEAFFALEKLKQQEQELKEMIKQNKYSLRRPSGKRKFMTGLLVFSLALPFLVALVQSA